MRNTYTALIRVDEETGGYWATCAEVPGSHGQGETREACLDDLAAAVQLLVDYHRENQMRLDSDEPRFEAVEFAVELSPITVTEKTA